MWGKWKEICVKSLQRKLFLRFAPIKLNMKLLYTINIFEFTLTKNGQKRSLWFHLSKNRNGIPIGRLFTFLYQMNIFK